MENSEKLWTGKVPDNWKFYKGKYLFGERSERGNAINLQLLSPTQKYGVIPQSMYDELTSMKSVKVKEDTDLSTFKTIHRGDFCISLRSFQGGFEYSEYEGVVSPAYHVLFSKMDICAGYYKYLFKEQRFIAEMNSYCQSLRDGKNISYFDFGRTLIPFPPLSEQQSIADYLDEACSKIDEIIAEAKASIDEYKELKQSVIFEAVTKGLSYKGCSNEKIDWVDEICPYWDVRQIRYLYELRKETNDKPLSEVNLISLYTDKGVIQHSDIGTENTTGNRAVSAEGYKIVYPNDIVVNIILCWMGAMGRSDYYGVTSPAYDVYKPIDETKVSSRYYHYLFRTDRFAKKCYTVGRGIMMMRWRTYSSEFRSIKVPVPTKTEQEEIADFLDKRTAEIDSLISEKESLINDLEAYKKSLIYEVVTGKRRVV